MNQLVPKTTRKYGPFSPFLRSTAMCPPGEAVAASSDWRASRRGSCSLNLRCARPTGKSVSTSEYRGKIVVLIALPRRGAHPERSSSESSQKRVWEPMKDRGRHGCGGVVRRGSRRPLHPMWERAKGSPSLCLWTQAGNLPVACGAL